MFNVSKLSNGLTILTYNMPTFNSVAVNLIVNAGSRYETDEGSGIAHFLEHMAFKGTKTRTAKQIAEEFDKIGGHFNAYTSHEQTVYYTKVLSENCHKAIEILADIIQNSVFAEEEIKKEYQVILQEIAHYQDTPEELIQEHFCNKAYENQPLGKSILGDSQILAGFGKEHFLKFVDKHYNAENMYLSVAGNVKHQDIVAFAEQLFTFLPQTPKVTFNAAQYIGGYQSVVKDLEQTTMLLGFESVSYINREQYYQAQLLASIFGGGMSSRLFQSIREELGLAYSVGSYNSCYHDSGVFTIFVSTANDKLPVLITQLVEEIKKLTESITDLELQRVKTQIKSSIYMAQEKTAYKSEEIGKNYAIFNRYIPVDETIESIMIVTSLDIMDIAEKILRSKPTLAIIGPQADNVDYHKLSSELR